jgi:hypothetical protein
MQGSAAAAGERLLNYYQDRVVAVFDSQSNLQTAIDELISSGFAQLFDAVCGTAGARLIDFSGENRGYLARMSHALHHMTVEGDYMDRYERELQAGHCIITVETKSDERRERAQEILHTHGAHFINHFGVWAVEAIHA